MKEEYLSMETVNKLAELEHIKEKMNNQVKITINNKEYYCDMEVLKLVDRLCDKVELLEYNRDKAIEHIKESINNYLKDDIDLDGTCNVMCYETIKKRYLKPVLDRLIGDSNE